jgi:ankyrin repeat protein
MTTHILLIVVLAMVCATPAWSTEKTKASDFVRSADNGNDLVVDLPGLVRALRSGADPNWINGENKPATSTLGDFIMLISTLRDPQGDTVGLQAIQALIAAGAKLQPEDRAILYWPVARGKTDMVALLLDMGADPTAWPKNFDETLSPVEIAAQEGHPAMVDLLVAHGASRPNEREAVQLRFIQVATFGTPEILDELLKKGASVNGKNRDNEVALVNAMRHVMISECVAYDKVLYLLDAGADPNMSGKGPIDTAPPLHHAVWFTSILFNTKGGKLGQCSMSLLSELIRRGAHVSSLDSVGRTPLHIAAQKSHLFAAQLLLEAGAKVKPRDETGKTPLDFAESGEMIKLLKSYGATER